MMRSSCLQELQSRGLIYQTTNRDGLEEMLNTQTITVYQGFDATGDSLHIGNLVGIMLPEEVVNKGEVKP